MIKYPQMWIVLILSTLLTGGCFAQTHPSNQLIQGEFEITEQWQEFTFEKPLISAPYIQKFELLSCNQKYELVTTEFDKENYFFTNDRFRRISDGKVIAPEVMVIVNDKSYHLAASSSGYYHSDKLKGCIHIGYGVSGLKDGNKFFFPEGVEIEKVKIKANASLKIDMFHWIAPDYWRVGKYEWRDINPAEIIDF